MSEGVKVAVRVRPFSPAEMADQSGSCVVFMKGQTTTLEGVQQNVMSTMNFNFDKSYWSIDPAFHEYASQEMLYADIGHPLVANALDGYDGCLFAYGQTGSGKSYSMLGYMDTPGIIPRMIDELFQKKSLYEASGDKELRIWISHMDIYNECARDLLQPDKQKVSLKVVEHPLLGAHVCGLAEVPCSSPQDVQGLMDFSTKKRVASTLQMTGVSSHSHSILGIRIERFDGPKPRAGEKDSRKSVRAKVSLMDLAGSERQLVQTRAEHPSSTTAKKGCALNLGLGMLSSVVKELADMASGKVKEARPPFRASKICLLLKPALVGKAKSFMLGTVSPSSLQFEETLATLRFASSVRELSTSPAQNKGTSRELVETLRKEFASMCDEASAHGAMLSASVSLLYDQERILKDVSPSYEVQLEEDRRTQLGRLQEMQSTGLLQDSAQAAFHSSASTPYLINMSDDATLAGCLVYYMKPGLMTTFGSADDNVVVIRGLGISEHLCVFENSDNASLVVWKSGQAGRVVVGGSKLEEGKPAHMFHGQRIYLGRALALQVGIPESASGSLTENMDLRLEGLEAEWSAVEESPSWRNLQEYLSQVVHQISEDQAKTLWEEVKAAVMVCDEANEIAAELISEAGFHFEVDLTSAVPATVVVRVLRYVGQGARVIDQFAPVYVWSISQTQERLERMRCCYREHLQGYPLQVDPLYDPWHEAHPAELMRCITDLRARVEELLQENENLKQTRERPESRTFQPLPASSVGGCERKEVEVLQGDDKKALRKSGVDKKIVPGNTTGTNVADNRRKVPLGMRSKMTGKRQGESPNTSKGSPREDNAHHPTVTARGRREMQHHARQGAIASARKNPGPRPAGSLARPGPVISQPQTTPTSAGGNGAASTATAEGSSMSAMETASGTMHGDAQTAEAEVHDNLAVEKEAAVKDAAVQELRPIGEAPALDPLPAAGSGSDRGDRQKSGSEVRSDVRLGHRSRQGSFQARPAPLRCLDGTVSPAPLPTREVPFGGLSAPLPPEQLRTDVSLAVSPGGCASLGSSVGVGTHVDGGSCGGATFSPVPCVTDNSADTSTRFPLEALVQEDAQSLRRQLEDAWALCDELKRQLREYELKSMVKSEGGRAFPDVCVLNGKTDAVVCRSRSPSVSRNASPFCIPLGSSSLPIHKEGCSLVTTERTPTDESRLASEREAAFEKYRRPSDALSSTISVNPQVSRGRSVTSPMPGTASLRRYHSSGFMPSSSILVQPTSSQAVSSPRLASVVSSSTLMPVPVVGSMCVGIVDQCAQKPVVPRLSSPSPSTITRSASISGSPMTKTRSGEIVGSSACRPTSPFWNFRATVRSGSCGSPQPAAKMNMAVVKPPPPFAFNASGPPSPVQQGSQVPPAASPPHLQRIHYQQHRMPPKAPMAPSSPHGPRPASLLLPGPHIMATGSNGGASAGVPKQNGHALLHPPRAVGGSASASDLLMLPVASPSPIIANATAAGTGTAPNTNRVQAVAASPPGGGVTLLSRHGFGPSPQRS
eukprot:TRINITY_DN4843_c0_g3_i1.p1 TRINITY_DN4843_c0_g3~~TRINITY_DN4843_c0_g3_i1.p1  ORF type:complete len:1519 (+),score=228.91 TRINITY_DN4843_c0_g3_i1:83-4639(+)